MVKNSNVLEELINYANKAKRGHKKRKIEKNISINTAMRWIIERTIDALAENDSKIVMIEKKQTASFLIDGIQYSFCERYIPTTGLELKDIENVIDNIPTLKAKYCPEVIEAVMVWFSDETADTE